MKKIRKGPNVEIEYECRGCEYLKIIVGMCDLHVECKDGAWKGFATSQHQGSILAADKCRFKAKAWKNFVREHDFNQD